MMFFRKKTKTINSDQQNSSSNPRLIDYVEQTSSTALGPFANMMEDTKKASSQSVVLNTPILSAAVSFALDIGSSGLWVAGGVSEQLIADVDGAIVAFRADIGSDKRLHTEALKQAVDLANVYIPGITVNQALVVIMVTEQGSTLRQNGEGVLDTTEVLRRAEQLIPEYLG
jgi:hypothetical protein